VARCSIAISQAAAPTGRRSRSAAPAAATSWRPTEMAHRNCNAGVGSGVYVIAINLLFFYDRGRLFAPRQNNAATAGPLSVVVGERLSASIRAGPRDSEIAPTGSNRRGNNAAKRNSRSPFRYSAWLLGGDLSRHGVLPVVRKQPPRAAQQSHDLLHDLAAHERTPWLDARHKRHAPRLVCCNSRPGSIQPIDSEFSFLQ